jgi:hypothetical protein
MNVSGALGENARHHPDVCTDIQDHAALIKRDPGYSILIGLPPRIRSFDREIEAHDFAEVADDGSVSRPRRIPPQARPQCGQDPGGPNAAAGQPRYCADDGDSRFVDHSLEQSSALPIVIEVLTLSTAIRSLSTSSFTST